MNQRYLGESITGDTWHFRKLRIKNINIIENIFNFNNSVLAKHKLLPFFTFNDKTDVFMVLCVNSVTDKLANV